MRDARDPEREFTKNTRNVVFSLLTSSSFVVVVVFDDDDDETVAGEMTSSIISLFFLGSTSVLCVCSKARAKTQRQQREKKREKQLREDKPWVCRAPVSVCVLL